MPGLRSEPWDSAFSDQICYASLWVSLYAEDMYAHSTLCAEVRQRNCHVLRVLTYLDSVQEPDILKLVHRFQHLLREAALCIGLYASSGT